jgi:hypothetical protein
VAAVNGMLLDITTVTLLRKQVLVQNMSRATSKRSPKTQLFAMVSEAVVAEGELLGMLSAKEKAAFVADSQRTLVDVLKAVFGNPADDSARPAADAPLTETEARAFEVRFGLRASVLGDENWNSERIYRKNG